MNRLPIATACAAALVLAAGADTASEEPPAAAPAAPPASTASVEPEQAGDGGVHGPNLVANPGFEEGAEGWHLPDGFRVVQAAAGHSGGFFLATERTDATSYRLASQAVPCRPGRQYRISAWVRAKGVKGDESGATLCMEWSGKAGWIGGAYPSGMKGTTDWTRIETITPPIPDEAEHVSVKVYLRRGMTGEAHFDDVEVREYWGRPMEAFLLDPPYRGLIFAGEARRPVRVHVDLAERIGGHAWKEGEGWPGLKDLVLVTRLLVGGKVIAQRHVADVSQRSLEMQFDAEALPAGGYRVDVALARGPEVLARQVLGGRVLAQGDRPTVYIDRHGRTIVRGRPFFPLGFYFGTIKEDEIRTMSRAGFNCAMPYAFSSMDVGNALGLLGMARRHGVMVIYSIKDLYPNRAWVSRRYPTPEALAARVREVVERVRTHPNLLAWYLNDELPPSMRPDLEARYDLVRGLDPGHPTWAVLYLVDQLTEYRHTCDVLGTDPYPVARKPVAMAGEWARKTRQASLGTDAFWQVPQAFAWGACREPADAPQNRPPTYDEVRCMTYQALIAGAKGLIYYAWHHLADDSAGFESRWNDMSRIGREVRALEPALLSVDPVPAGLAVHGAPWAAFRDGKQVWVLVTNREPEPAGMRLDLPPGVVEVETMTGDTVSAVGGRVMRPLAPLACETYIVELP